MITAVCLFPPLVYAQASRTWVSGVGDDVNPCSRTAPCKTFAGAISKTAPSGEIDALDPGGFGGFALTKSIVIDGLSGLTSVLVASGANGINVYAASSDVVILRNLEINGIGTGGTGIFINGAGDVRVENCKIYGFTNRGIDDRRTSGHLFVSNTVVSNNGQTAILALSSGSTLTVNLDHVQMHSNGNAGLAITGGTQATVVNSWATSNFHGFYADSGAILNLNDSVSFGNVNTGINSSSGASIRMANTTVTNNGTGLYAGPGSTILSYGTNRIVGNAAGNGPPTGFLAVQ
jgi:hypothetical protein